MLIGKETFTSNEYRTPNAMKAAICEGFEKAPSECDQVLEGVVQGATGGCQADGKKTKLKTVENSQALLKRN